MNLIPHKRSKFIDRPGGVLPRTLGALLSAGLLTLAMPKFGFAPLSLIGLIPLAVALRGVTARQGLIIGFIFGLAVNLGLLYWIAGVVEHYGGLPFWLAGIIQLLLLAILGIYPALWSAGYAALVRTGRSGILAGALGWAGLEWVRGWLFSGFPWMDLGYGLSPWPWAIQIADLGGVGLAGLVVVLTNLGLAEFFGPRGSARPIRALLLLAVTWALVLGYGGWRIGELSPVLEKAEKIRVRVVQGNIDQSRKWDRAFLEKTLETYGRFSRVEDGAGPKLIIWPETAVPYYFHEGRPEDRQLLNLARETGSHLLFGAPAVDRTGTEMSYLNRAWLVTPEGAVGGHLDKAHLVPYGEYVPFKSYLPFLGKIVAQVGDYTAGPEGQVLATAFGRVGALICYESIFPELAEAQTLNGAGLLVNMTNDAWFGRTSAPYQHLVMLRWRAIENRRSIGRAAQTGISALIDPLGRLTAELDLGRAGQLTGDLPILTEKTIYHRGGQMLPPLSLVLAVGLLIGRLARRKR